MSYCPVCKHQFEDDEKECPSDKVPLVEDLPFLTVEGNGTAWVEIASVVTQDEARLLKGFLESEGIPVEIESLKFNMEPVNLGALAEIRVFVDASREKDAIEILEEQREKFEAQKDGDEDMADGGPVAMGDSSDEENG